MLIFILAAGLNSANAQTPVALRLDAARDTFCSVARESLEGRATPVAGMLEIDPFLLEQAELLLPAASGELGVAVLTDPAVSGYLTSAGALTPDTIRLRDTHIAEWTLEDNQVLSIFESSFPDLVNRESALTGIPPVIELAAAYFATRDFRQSTIDLTRVHIVESLIRQALLRHFERILDQHHRAVFCEVDSRGVTVRCRATYREQELVLSASFNRLGDSRQFGEIEVRALSDSRGSVRLNVLNPTFRVRNGYGNAKRDLITRSFGVTPVQGGTPLDASSAGRFRERAITALLPEDCQ